MAEIDPGLAILQQAAETSPASPATDSGLAILQTQANAPAQQDQPQSQGVVSNVGNDWNGRVSNLLTGIASGQSTPETALQLGGQVAGGIGDVIGEGVNSLTPQPYVDAAHSLGNALNSTETGQSMGDMLLSGKDALSSALDSNPRAARDAGAVANLLTLSVGGSGVGAIEGTGAKLGLGDALYNSGKAAQDAARQDYIGELILPKQTPTVKADMATRTRQIGGTNVYMPTQQEQRIASTIASIPGVSPKNSAVKNLGHIQDANSQEAEALKQRLMQNDAPIPDDSIQNALMGIRDQLAKSTNISGPGQAVTARVLNAGLDHITNNPQTASGMLEARKAFDKQMINEKGEGILDPSVESPRSNAVALVRQAMNGMVSDAVPSADVVTSLQKQNDMFNAIDNIAPKAANEAATALGRMIQKVTPSNVAEGAKGMGALLAAKEILPHVPPSVIGTTLAGYGLYKGATSPATRIALGKALGVSAP